MDGVPNLGTLKIVSKTEAYVIAANGEALPIAADVLASAIRLGVKDGQEVGYQTYAGSKYAQAVGPVPTGID